MDEEWDADNFQPKEMPTATSISVNKWEGEDEDEDVKDNWEDEEEEEEEEEKKDVEKQEPVKPVQQQQQQQPPKKPKSKLQEKIEEKERKMQEEAEKRAKVKPELTPEELLAEKLRQQKLQEESDLRVAMETFGVGEPSSASGIDAMNPNTKEEFDELQLAISKKVQQYSKSQHFPTFAEDLIRNICVNLTSYDLKKLKITVENMFLEKSKAEKGEKAKSKKGKGKPKVKVEGENTLVHIGEYYDDYEDFM